MAFRVDLEQDEVLLIKQILEDISINWKDSLEEHIEEFKRDPEYGCEKPGDWVEHYQGIVDRLDKFWEKMQPVIEQAEKAWQERN